MPFDAVTYAAGKGGAIKSAKSYIDACIAALPKGVIYKGTVASTSNLPTPSSSNIGWMYTVQELEYREVLSDGTQWIDISASNNVYIGKVDVASGEVQEQYVTFQDLKEKYLEGKVIMVKAHSVDILPNRHYYFNLVGVDEYNSGGETFVSKFTFYSVMNDESGNNYDAVMTVQPDQPTYDEWHLTMTKISNNSSDIVYSGDVSVYTKIGQQDATIATKQNQIIVSSTAPTSPTNGLYWDDTSETLIAVPIDTAVMSGSNNAVSGGAVYSGLQERIAMPSGGSTGNVLTKTESGVEWGTGSTVQIDDSTTAADKVWSSQKTNTTISGKYSKPSGGIPKTDLTSAVQTSLGKADSAEQTSNRVEIVDSSSDKYHYPTAKAVYDSFRNIFNVHVQANNSEWGTVSGSGVFLKNSSVTITATPASGYRFVRWKDNTTGLEISTTASYTFTLNMNRNITAMFFDENIPSASWSSGTDVEIATMIAAADAGAINLSDYWSIGDVRSVSLTATAADSAREIEAHAAQTAELVIMDFTCTGFTVNGSTPNAIVGLKNGLLETGQMNTNNINDGGWRDCKRRSWCNTEFKNSLPSATLAFFKQFEWSQGKGSGASSGLLTTQDYFGLAPEKCIFGSSAYSFADEAALYNHWSWYQTASNRIKKYGPSGSAGDWWECSPYSGNSYRFCSVNSNGSAIYYTAYSSRLLAPFGCI